MTALPSCPEYAPSFASAAGTTAWQSVDERERLARWVAQVVLGNQRALASLHGATSSRVAAISLRIVRRPDLAEEVVGEIFWQVWREAARYSPDRGSVMSWLVAMARSRAIDLLRRHDGMQRHESPLDEELDGHESSFTESAPYCLETVDRDTQLRRLLQRAEPVHRQLIALAFFEGLSHQEIANHSGLALGTVKSHLRRGLQAMRNPCLIGGLTPSFHPA